MTRKIGYVWHLRRLMAEHGMFATTDLGPLLAMRGVTLVARAGLPARHRDPRTAQPDHPGRVVRHPGLRAGRSGRARGTRRAAAGCLVVSRVRGPPGPVRPRRARILPGPGTDA